MAVDKGKRRAIVDDPAVGAALSPSDGLYGKIARARGMTAAQRKKAERDRKRSKVTYDLPEELISEVTRLAKELDCPAAHVAAALILEGMKAEPDLKRLRVPANSPRFVWYLDLSGE